MPASSTVCTRRPPSASSSPRSIERPLFSSRAPPPKPYTQNTWFDSRSVHQSSRARLEVIGGPSAGGSGNYPTKVINSLAASTLGRAINFSAADPSEQATHANRLGDTGASPVGCSRICSSKENAGFARQKQTARSLGPAANHFCPNVHPTKPNTQTSSKKRGFDSRRPLPSCAAVVQRENACTPKKPWLCHSDARQIFFAPNPGNPTRKLQVQLLPSRLPGCSQTVKAIASKAINTIAVSILGRETFFSRPSRRGPTRKIRFDSCRPHLSVRRRSVAGNCFTRNQSIAASSLGRETLFRRPLDQALHATRLTNR
jgi:hypothetical protein